MKRYLTTFVAVAMLVGLGLTIGCHQRAVEPVIDVAEPPPEVSPEDLAALVEGNNQFALDLYKKLAETEKGNIFFSPYSIHAATGRGEGDEEPEICGTDTLSFDSWEAAMTAYKSPEWSAARAHTQASGARALRTWVKEQVTIV